MTIRRSTRRTLSAVCATSALLLTAVGCSSADEANTEACDGVSGVLTQINEDATAAGSDEKARSQAFTTAADRLDELAATEGIDTELADRLEAGAEAARAEAAGENEDVTEPDRTIRGTLDLCEELRG